MHLTTFSTHSPCMNYAPTTRFSVCSLNTPSSGLLHWLTLLPGKPCPQIFIWLTPTYLSHPIKVHLPQQQRGLSYRLLSLKDAPPPLLALSNSSCFYCLYITLPATTLSICRFILFLFLPLLLSLPTKHNFQLSRDQIGFIYGYSL